MTFGMHSTARLCRGSGAWKPPLAGSGTSRDVMLCLLGRAGGQRRSNKVEAAAGNLIGFALAHLPLLHCCMDFRHSSLLMSLATVTCYKYLLQSLATNTCYRHLLHSSRLSRPDVHAVVPLHQFLPVYIVLARDEAHAQTEQKAQRQFS